jgi:hypothetical protein
MFIPLPSIKLSPGWQQFQESHIHPPTRPLGPGVVAFGGPANKGRSRVNEVNDMNLIPMFSIYLWPRIEKPRI